jgi:hypothetical protein
VHVESLLFVDPPDERTQLNAAARLALKIVDATLERSAIQKILTRLRPDAQPPPKGRAREAARAGVFAACCLTRVTGFVAAPFIDCTVALA